MTQNIEKILIVEDNQRHLETVDQLIAEGHQVDIVNTFAGAIDKLTNSDRPYYTPVISDETEKKRYDVVLTDLMLPYGYGPMRNVDDRSVESPLGFGIIFASARLGIPKVGLLTDTNHHDTPVSATMDHIKIPLLGERYASPVQEGYRPVLRINETDVVMFDVRDGLRTPTENKDYHALYHAIQNVQTKK